MDIKNASKLTFGILIGPFPPWKQIVEWAQLIESLGFDKLWLPDHFVNPNDIEMDWLDCWCTLSALATQTQKITIGSLVSSMTLRNPAVLARMALALDHICNGRFEFGVGAAGTMNCHKMTGVPRWDRRERSERYQEFIEILDHMLHNEVTSYEGKFYNIQEAIMHPDFIKKPHPVFNIAAHGPKALRLAAKYGDAWNSLGTSEATNCEQNSAATRERCERLCEYADAAGRDPAQIGRTILFGWTIERPFSSIDAFYDMIGRYAEAGVDDFAFIYSPDTYLWPDQSITSRDLLQRIALEAIPAIRNGSILSNLVN